MNLLLLAFGFPVQYRALRCAASTGAKVFVLGAPLASGLRFSRYCERFIPLDDTFPAADVTEHYDYSRLGTYIEEIAAIFKIDVVLGGDSKATRILTTLKERLSVSVFPVPSTDTFDLLNDKWTFRGLCLELGIPTPQTWLFHSKGEVLRTVEANRLPSPLIAKPLRGSGRRGHVAFTREDADKKLANLDYRPILIQEFIEGEDHVLSIFAVAGKIVASSCHYRKGNTFFFPKGDTYLQYASIIAAHLKLDGVYCFDARVTDRNEIYLLETNPRMYLSMDYDLIAGFNSVDLGLKSWDRFQGLPWTASGSVTALFGIVKKALTPWRICRRDLDIAVFLFSDPLPQLIDVARLILQRFPAPARRTLYYFRQLRPLLD